MNEYEHGMKKKDGKDLQFEYMNVVEKHEKTQYEHTIIYIYISMVSYEYI